MLDYQYQNYKKKAVYDGQPNSIIVRIFDIWIYLAHP